MGTKVITVIGGATDPDERIRIEWGQNLADHCAELNVDKHALRRRLDEEHGIQVSRQTVEAWLSGKWAPKPHVQAALGTILNVPARLLFPIRNAERKVA